MFNKELYNLTLTSEIANEVFPNISGRAYGTDQSFLATLRALLAPRMSESDTLYLDIRTTNQRESALKEYSDEDNVRRLSDGIANNTILVCGFSGTEATVNYIMKCLDNNFIRVFANYAELKDLRAFVQKQANMRFYINEEDRSVVVFVAGLNPRLYHFVQSFTSRLFPWYFKDSPLNDDERNLVKALTAKSAPEYERLIEAFAQQYDFRGKKIEKMLGGFETAAKRTRLQSAESNLSRTESEINRCVERYRDYLQTREQQMLEIAGLKYQIAHITNDSEIMDYFRCNRHLNPISVGSSSLEFVADGYLENFDVDMYERISQNFDGYMYTGYDVSNSAFESVHTRKKFMDAIFSDDPLLKIKMCGFYRIDLSGYVETSSGYSYPVEYNDMLPNTHLQRHSCLGNQKPLIEEALRNGDYIGAIEQCVCSAKSINVGESATFPYMLKAIFASGAKKIIELPDGTSVSPTEALRWLEAQETQTNNNGEAVSE